MASKLVAVLLGTVLYEAAFNTLAVAHEESIRAGRTAAGRAVLTLAAETRGARDAGLVKPEVPLLALFALKTIVTQFAIDVQVLSAQLTEAVLDERTLNAALIRKDV